MLLKRLVGEVFLRCGKVGRALGGWKGGIIDAGVVGLRTPYPTLFAPSHGHIMIPRR